MQKAVAKHGPKKVWAAIPKELRKQLFYTWEAWARPNQLEPPGSWRYWFIQAGRGYGKTRTAVEWVRKRIKAGARRIALAGPTDDHIRHKMIEDPDSGLLRVFPENERPVWRPGLKQVFFHNGAIGHCYSAIKPDRARGSQQDTLWGDEVSSWAYEDALTQLKFGLRVGDDPRGVLSSTPKRNKITKKLIADKKVYVTRGTTYENAANLSEAFYEDILEEFEGTRMGRQEIFGELLDDNPNALWSMDLIDELRFRSDPDELDVSRIGIGVDPPGSTAECGIVVAAIGLDGHGYVLEDCSIAGKPKIWAQQAIDAAEEWEADFIVVETNFGGDMVKHTIESMLDDDQTIRIVEVRASRGKAVRAEPIVGFYEKHKVHHVGSFPVLEDQMCEWEPGDESPDRLDALVWIMTKLLVGKKRSRIVIPDDAPTREPIDTRFMG